VVYDLSGQVEAIGAVAKLRQELEELRDENERLKWKGAGGG
jgi:hypothetical protein